MHGQPLLAKHDSKYALMHYDSASVVAEIDGSARDGNYIHASAKHGRIHASTSCLRRRVRRRARVWG